MGGLAAALAAIPYHIWRPSTGSGASGGGLLLRRMGTASILGCLGGGAFLAMGVYQKLTASEPYGVYDRAYRLRHNKGQVRGVACVGRRDACRVPSTGRSSIWMVD